MFQQNYEWNIKIEIFLLYSVKAPIIQKIEKTNDEIKEVKQEKEMKKYPPGSYVVSGKKDESVFLSGSELKLISAFGSNVQLLLTDCENVLISR